MRPNALLILVACMPTFPLAGGALLAGSLVALGLRLVISGALKAGYDLTLWRVFRRVPMPAAPRS